MNTHFVQLWYQFIRTLTGVVMDEREQGNTLSTFGQNRCPMAL
jgi:hypothetical protein